MGKVTLKGFIVVPEDEIDLVEQELQVHTDLTLKEAGCITFKVTKSDKIHNRFEVYEEFADRTAFDAHQIRVKASHWGEVTLNVERHYEIYEE